MNENEVFEQSNADETNEEMTYIDRKDIGVFTNRLSGKSATGESKVAISYQTYALEDPEESPDRERVYSLNTPHIELSIDPRYPQFYVMDIVFRSCNDPELKMLWGRLQRFKRNMATNLEKTWIFYFNVLERASITSQTAERDRLLIANILNPTMYYLTREVPDMLAPESVSENGELYGGNVIRMLVPTEFVTFQITEDVDTTDIKGEIQREADARAFLDNSEDNNNQWYE